MELQAWHFCGKRLRDGRPIPPDGEWLKHEGRVEICESGFHYSLRVIDALPYAPGSTICRVTVADIVTTQTDKGVCRRRRIDWRITDADELLRAFARKCALSVIHLWDAQAIVRQYLETGDESIRAAARDAAWAAASAAARWTAARDAACAAAWTTAKDAARAAARDAAWAAARATARDAAWAAASAAARDAARDAKLSDFNAQLEQMLTEHHAGLVAPGIGATALE